MKYLFDTNICIYAMKNRSEKLIQKIQSCDSTDLVVSSITLSELEYGIAKSEHKTKNKIELIEFLNPITIASYNQLATQYYGEIRAYLERKGELIGPLDILIAAHCMSLNLTLITNNEREFRRIPNLKVENWI